MSQNLALEICFYMEIAFISKSIKKKSWNRKKNQGLMSRSMNKLMLL